MLRKINRWQQMRTQDDMVPRFWAEYPTLSMLKLLRHEGKYACCVSYIWDLFFLNNIPHINFTKWTLQGRSSCAPWLGFCGPSLKIAWRMSPPPPQPYVASQTSSNVEETDSASERNFLPAAKQCRSMNHNWPSVVVWIISGKHLQAREAWEHR